MSKKAKKLIHPSKNVFKDRRAEKLGSAPSLTITLETLDSILLLLNSEEEMILINIMNYLTQYIREDHENLELLKDKNMFELILQKEFHRSHSSIIVKRFSLNLAVSIMEHINCLKDLKTAQLLEILKICLSYYTDQEDDVCIEYLSVMINKCFDDPQAVKVAMKDGIFWGKFYSSVANLTNPDAIYHSFELMEKVLRLEGDIQSFYALPIFPINRLLCELTNEFSDIRKSSLKVIRLFILDICQENNPFNKKLQAVKLLEQLTEMFCMDWQEESDVVIEVLAAAMRYENMAFLFFDLNLFDKYLSHINNGPLEFPAIDKALLVFCECAQYGKLLPRLVMSGVLEKILNCLLIDHNIPPTTHIIYGLNCMTKSPEACRHIVEAYDQDLLKKLLKLLTAKEIPIKTREQVAVLLYNLLSYAFHRTASELLELRLTSSLAEIFGQAGDLHSIDLLLSLLNILEVLAENVDYRAKVSDSELLITNIGVLLTKSFSTAILVNNIFRCLCTMVLEESVRTVLLKTYINASIKRALLSLSKLVKTSATNFIMQTTVFPEFIREYIDNGVLEGLIMNQKHAYFIPTWSLAIESILSKTPTLKFCIRNHLSFTDITVGCGCDFMVSKKKFEDFRIFQNILKEDVSPMQPVLIVNFDRPKTPEDLVVKVPINCLQLKEFNRGDANEEWCYCRTPGDEYLPRYLQEVHSLMNAQGLTGNSGKFKSSIDFDNITKRVKIIAQVVVRALNNDMDTLDINCTEKCPQNIVNDHLKALAMELHCTFIPLGRVRSGCEFERAVLFKSLSDQIGLPCTLQRSVDGRVLFNELPLPLELDQEDMGHCDEKTLQFMPWRMLRPTHIVDLMYNVGDLYPIQSRQALQYLGLC